MSQDGHTGTGGREVSCRVLSVLFEELSNRGLPSHYLTEAVGHSADFLLDPNERISWAAFSKVLRNAGHIWTDEQLAEISGRFPDTPAARPFNFASRVFLAPPELYHWMVMSPQGPAHRFVSCKRYRFRELEDGRLELRLVMNDGYEPCREFGLMVKGIFVKVPRLIGLADAEVELQDHPDGHTLLVRPPKSAGLLRRLRRAISWAAQSGAVAAELRETLESLETSHEALRVEFQERRRAEGALRESEKRLRSVIQHAPVALFALDPEGTVTLSEGSALRDLGLRPGERVGQNILEVYKDHPTIARDTRRALGGESFGTTAEVGDRVIETWFSPHLDEDGQPAGTIGVAIDVSERLRAESAARESEGWFRAIFLHAKAGIAVVTPDGTIEETNPYLCSLLGHTEDELRGKHITDVTHPDERTAVREYLRSNRDEFVEFERRYIHKDGSVVWSETVAGWIHDANGNPTHRIGVVRDVTEKVATERALRESEAKQRAAFDNFPYQFWAMDTEGRYTMQNLASREASGDDLIGKTVDDLNVPDGLKARYKANDRRVLGGEVLSFECEQPVAGEMRSYVGISGPIRIDGEIHGIVGVLIDVTEQRQEEKRRLSLEDELRRKHRMESLGTLAGGIAHDFNNVLTAILGNAQLAGAKLEEGHGAHRNLGEILTSGKRARDLIEQILAFSRSDPGARTPIVIQDPIADALRFLRSTLPKSIEIRETLHATAGVVEANSTQIYQVVLNLGANAHHAMADGGGVLEVSTEEIEVDETLARSHVDLRPGPYVLLTVRDTGTGIDEGIVDRVFDPFFTTKDVGQGSGLGLSVVHGIVRDHGGGILIEPGDEVGTSVHVFLPCATAATCAADAEEPAVELQQGTGHVVFVDDEEAILRSAREMLELLGYEVTTFPSGEEALEALESRPQGFDLVITDQNMPRMSGETFARRLKKIRPDVPAIVCTGFSEHLTPDRATEAGFDGFLKKPLLLEELGKSVHEALGGATAKGG